MHAPSGGANDLTFILVEYSSVPSHVVITHYFNDLIDYGSWAFWNRITIGTGDNSMDVFPVYKPKRWVTHLSLYEQLTYQIHDISEFNLWKDAVLIRAKGEKYYADFRIN